MSRTLDCPKVHDPDTHLGFAKNLQQACGIARRRKSKPSKEHDIMQMAHPQTTQCMCYRKGGLPQYLRCAMLHGTPHLYCNPHNVDRMARLKSATGRLLCLATALHSRKHMPSRT
jgi:hypothetical protein